MKRQGALWNSRANEKIENLMRMNRILAAARPCVLLIAASTFATAQQPAPSAPAPADELATLRQAVEQQSKQIEALTQQISELNRRMSGQKEAAPAPPSSPSIESPATSQPAATPSAGTASPQAAEPKSDAAGAGSGLKHTVARGETLTSIAKRYNIPLPELEKANKITDDRKLQIGHVLNIPTTANKAPEPPTEKKENP